MKRRDWIRTVGAAGLAGATGVPFSLAGAAPPTAGPPLPGAGPDRGPIPFRANEVRSIIFFALDGTGFEDLATASFFSQRLRDRPLLYQELLGRGGAGVMFPHSLTSVVTDSAAATTAWSTGRKVVNGALAQYPDGRDLHTILELAREAGKATGLVTSTRITHATPAGWIARVPDRDMDGEIARQYLEFRPDVLLGGGIGPFLAAEREDGRDLAAEFGAAGYDVLRTREDLARSSGSRLFGAFTPGTNHLAFEIDRAHQGAESPSLADITRKALEVLDGAERGFVLQVEAGRIDHANHDNDPGGFLWDWMAADDALRVIVEYVDRNPGTLLLSAADHDTGGGVLYGLGSRYNSSTQAFNVLSRARASHVTLRARLGRNPGEGEVAETVRELLGFEPTADQVQGLLRILQTGERHGHSSAHSSRLHSLQFLLSGVPSGEADRPNLSFATGNHTGGVVPVFCYGAGVDSRSLGAVDNTDLFHWMTAALGMEGFENPYMSEAEALRYAALLPEAEEERPHWV